MFFNCMYYNQKGDILEGILHPAGTHNAASNTISGVLTKE